MYIYIYIYTYIGCSTKGFWGAPGATTYTHKYTYTYKHIKYIIFT